MHKIELDDALQFLEFGDGSLVLELISLWFAQRHTGHGVVHKDLKKKGQVN